MKFKNINDVHDYLNTLGMFRMKPGQNRVQKSLTTLQLLPMPFPSIQIVGTNGKGSTSTFFSYLAQEHGLKTGLYTSPHFVSPKERIQINNKELENSIWVECANAVYEKGKELTYFEFLTVLSVKIFTEQKIDLAIFEAGLGGKFDATTALNCPYIAFTPIDLDHTQILGKRISEIATDKAHAVSRYTKQVFSAKQCLEVEEILTQHCSVLQVPFTISEPKQELELGLKGQHQEINSSLALSIWKIFFPTFFGKNSNSEKEINALKMAFIPGRLQHVSLPFYNNSDFNIILDGGHNAHGLLGLKKYLMLEEITPSAIIFSCMADKDLKQIIPILHEILDFASCPLFIPQIQDNERAIKPHILAELLQKEGIQSFPKKDISEALESSTLLSTKEKPVLICGSLYLLADFYIKYPNFLYQNLKQWSYTMNELFRAIPSVNKLLDMLQKNAQAELAYDPHSPNLIIECSPPLLTSLINEYLDILRENINKGKITHIDQISNEILLKELLNYIYKVLQPNLQKVINGTGVVIHTNLGRSLLSKSAVQAIHLAANSYVNLEFNMATGERGSRHDVVLSRLKRITKAEDALVVNNNAAAVLLVLDALAKNGETIISRGELVEVGGSFRIPEVMEHSGTTLKEVGTTNRTHTQDYLKAINENTKVLMRVHTSNFRVIGFSSIVPTEELAKIAKDHNIPLIEDLGSGSFLDFSPFGLPKEPTVQEAIEHGVDVVTFSGDKLLGGPQAGIIVGKKKYIDIIRKNQLLRALRPCKLTLAALEATLNHYLQPETLKDNIPTLKMIALSYNDVLAKAQVLQSTLSHYIKLDKAQIALHEDSSRVGGGAFPEFPLPTVLVQIIPHSISPLELKERFLQSTPAVVGRLDEKSFSLDPRTIADQDYDIIARILSEIL